MQIGKCWVETQTVVQIRIMGERQDQPSDKLPRVRDDGGLVSELLKWMVAEEVLPAPDTGGSSGGGCYVGYFSPSTATKVMEWLWVWGQEWLRK